MGKEGDERESDSETGRQRDRELENQLAHAPLPNRISEKKRIQEEEKLEEKRLDLLMEIERLKLIQKDELRIQREKKKKMEVNAMLMQQKEEALKAKMLEEERKIQEGIMMVKL